MPTIYDAMSNLATTMGSAVSSVSSGLSTTNGGISSISSGLSSISSGLSDVSTKPFMIANYALASLPDAAANNHKIIRVPDATGGEKICQSDGTHWLLINTTTVVS